MTPEVKKLVDKYGDTRYDITYDFIDIPFNPLSREEVEVVKTFRYCTDKEGSREVRAHWDARFKTKAWIPFYCTDSDYKYSRGFFYPELGIRRGTTMGEFYGSGGVVD